MSLWRQRFWHHMRRQDHSHHSKFRSLNSDFSTQRTCEVCISPKAFCIFLRQLGLIQSALRLLLMLDSPLPLTQAMVSQKVSLLAGLSLRSYIALNIVISFPQPFIFQGKTCPFFIYLVRHHCPPYAYTPSCFPCLICSLGYINILTNDTFIFAFKEFWFYCSNKQPQFLNTTFGIVVKVSVQTFATKRGLSVISKSSRWQPIRKH